MRRLRVDAPAEINPTRNAVEIHDGASTLQSARVVRLVAHRDLVLLGRVEVVAEDVGLLLLPNLAPELEPADRVWVRH